MKETTGSTASKQLEDAKLMAKLTFQMEKFCQEKENFFATRYRLTPTQFRCLRIIKELKQTTTKELSIIMKLTPGRITHLLNSLESYKLIHRKADKKDRRSVKVTLTKDAHPYIESVIEEYIKLHEDILKYLPADRREEILDSMSYFFEALKLYADDLDKTYPW